MHNYLEFEKPIAELEGKIEELRHLSGSGDVNIADEVGRLQGKVEKLLVQAYSKLTPWQKTQVARHHDRPHAADYIGGFPEHPHRGFETVTYMLEGRMRHRDHMGNEGVIGSGGVQWMSAGRGVLHSEMP